MIKEHDCVVLTSELASEGLLSGDVGTVVHIHGNAAAYEVEFATLTGRRSPSPLCCQRSAGRLDTAIIGA
jgi:hypothetical protein